jgi:hypothetical protein|tara:strand:- start:93 stop:854 length:762 start_codon:yes stop_codon:yes gene_type:complete
MVKYNILLEQLEKFYSIKTNLLMLIIILNNKSGNDIQLQKTINYLNNNLIDNKENDITYKFINKYLKSNKTKKISLRLIDWFVTNYCKKKKISLKIDNSNKVEYINIYDSYKSNLKAFSKQIFDPFRRKNQIIIVFDKNKNNKYNISFKNIIYKKNSNYIKTTIGQLNFFKWIIDNNIYDYIKENKIIIEKDMIYSQKENNKKKLDKNNLITKIIKKEDGTNKIVTRKKRNELSKSKSKNIHLHKADRIIYFD